MALASRALLSDGKCFFPWFPSLSTQEGAARRPEVTAAVLETVLKALSDQAITVRISRLLALLALRASHQRRLPRLGCLQKSSPLAVSTPPPVASGHALMSVRLSAPSVRPSAGVRRPEAQGRGPRRPRRHPRRRARGRARAFRPRR